MALKLVATGDGSHSLYWEQGDEHYHSVHGAIAESMHVFIEQGLQPIKVAPLQILEVGLGTGLNAFLTYLQSTERTIEYTAIEAHPLKLEMIQQLNYVEQLSAGDQLEAFEKIHKMSFDVLEGLGDHFTFRKWNSKLEDCDLPKDYFQLVYFDAFAPRVQPELWTISIFEQLYQAMQPKGVLVTYCAKGEVKRNLKAAGFSVEALPGPPGKREMTKAVKA